MSLAPHLPSNHPSDYDHTRARIVASPSRVTEGYKAAAAAAVAAVPDSACTPTSGATDYRTSIHFLTTPSSAGTAVHDMDFDDFKDCAPPNSVPVSTLLSPKTAGAEEMRPRNYSGSTFHGSASTTPPRRDPVSLPPIHISGNNAQYRDDELTGMAGLMELASPPHAIHSAGATRYTPSFSPNGGASHFGPMSETYNSRLSSASTASHSVPAALSIGSGGSPGAFATPPYAASAGQQMFPHKLHPQQSRHTRMPSQQQQQIAAQQANYAAQHGAAPVTGPSGTPQSASSTNNGVLTPESLSSLTSKGTRSFPPTADEIQVSRRRSQSTDSMQAQHGMGYNASSALPNVLGNANIRNRSMTATQRQRTSDTPLFPILLYRIINDSRNETWIRWCEDGKAFKFSSADNLLACLQAAGLRAQNYHSIEKNLNDYRFVRLTDQRRKIPDHDGKLWWMFSHPQFLRDFPDGIVNIQRRRRTNPPPVSPQPSAIPTQTQPQIQQQHNYTHNHPSVPQQGSEHWM
ncbi:Heat shock transcription factor [Coemansia sp. RSA 988]|nr:Heat shock transcription factor [Coemansia sp. RSA 988]